MFFEGWIDFCVCGQNGLSTEASNYTRGFLLNVMETRQLLAVVCEVFMFADGYPEDERAELAFIGASMCCDIIIEANGRSMYNEHKHPHAQNGVWRERERGMVTEQYYNLNLIILIPSIIARFLNSIWLLYQQWLYHMVSQIRYETLNCFGTRMDLRHH